jgi:hypothetical protein
VEQTIFGNRIPEREERMKIRSGYRNIVGLLMLGAFLAGCFVPIAYGVYAVYEDATKIKVTVNVKEKPEVVYEKTLALIKQRGVAKITKEDAKEMEAFGVKDGQPASMKVTSLRGGESATLTLTQVKGKDADQQKKDMENLVLSSCKEMGLTCTKEEKK